MVYNAKRAIADLGFIEAYSRTANLPGDDTWFESFLEALDRLEDFVRKGYLLTGMASPEELSNFLYDAGFVRGSIWNDKIPYAVSEALKEVVNFVTENQAWCSQRPEPKEEMLSDQARDALLNAAGDGECLFRLGLSGEIDATQDAIVRYTSQELGATDRVEAKEWAGEARREWEAEKVLQPEEQVVEAKHAEPDTAEEPAEVEVEHQSQPDEPDHALTPFNPSGKMGRREWTPEQRAAQAERARGSKTPPFDDDLAAVKVDFDAGLSMDAIGKRWGCSGGHIRNFLTKHGIDPRRGHPRSRKSHQMSVDEDLGGVATPENPPAAPSEDIVTTAIDSSAEDQSAVEDETRPSGTPETSPPHRLTVAHPGYAGKREDGQLNDDDWPHIKARLDWGDTRRAIASDYDVEPEDLEFFIASNERREAKQPPGEARAPLRVTMGGAN